MAGVNVYPVRFGKYLLLDTLLTGGMAQLYLAKFSGAEGFEKFVVIKQILPHLTHERDLVTAFIDEAKLAAQLHHTNIVQIYDFGEIDGSYFISMEYLRGKDLRALMCRAKERTIPLALDHCLYIASKICAALEYAHNYHDRQGYSFNIIHRDVSPQNIFVTYDGDVKLIDFGIAKASSRTTHTQFGLIKGKIAYMSPEQALGKEIDLRSDIFSAGIILYEMVTNSKMFTGGTMQVLAKVQKAEFVPAEIIMPGLPDRLYTILNRSLAWDPGHRYQTCAEMLTDIEECIFEHTLRSTGRRLALFVRELFEEEITDTLVARSDTADAAAPAAPSFRERQSPSAHAASLFRKLKQAALVRVPWAYTLTAAGILLTVLMLLLLDKEIPPFPAGAPAGLSGSAGAAAADPAARNRVRAAEILTAAREALVADPNKARGLVTQALALDSESAAAYRTLGLIEFTSRNYRAAAQDFTKAGELDPDSAESFFYLASSHDKLKDFEKAAVNYRKCLALSPTNADAYFNLGYIYLTVLNDPSRAERMYAEAAKLSPPYLDEVLFNLAVAQNRQNKKSQCIKNLKRCLEINPHNALARDYLKTLAMAAQ